MTRHNIETVRETIETLRDRETVYKVEVDELKFAFSNAFEADTKIIRERFVNAGKWQNLSEAESAVEGGMPYESRHWYGKKFSKTLEDAPQTDFVDAIRSHRNRWRPLFNALQDLIKRQTKGRKPVESTKTVIGTRTQLRAICPCCFREQAVKGDLMVAHGYQLLWEQQVGNCYGVNKPHFGTEAGKAVTAEIIENTRATARTRRLTAASARSGELRLRDKKTMQWIDNPTKQQFENYAYQCESDARSMDYQADSMQKMLDAWAPAEPREVEVEITE